ncbi:O-antigen/teichoic acid export membrane protein [Methylohalomonas lacus]|uniref:O-antigen/teichoic acid export membrane protein n=1 Tax=Methylohalomonas lacus TaxID=398773 RepID=A0AAE3HN89_9GAMM|nr:flippase [Methylohalomonas lacus]MCS3904366.1 O-antigen/teichoic acid export membrane protein [Methylohalomonas lacus]
MYNCQQRDTRWYQRLRGMTVGDSLRARLIRAGFGSAGLQAVNRILLLILAIILARVLGAEGYGIYAFAFAIMRLLMVGAEAGMPALLMREIATSHGREQWGLLRGALRRAGQFVTLVATVISLIGLGILWWLSERFEPAVVQTIGLMLLALPAAAMVRTLAAALQGLHRVIIGQSLDMLWRPLLVLLFVSIMFLMWPEWRQPQSAMAVQVVALFLVLMLGALLLWRILMLQVGNARPEFRTREWLKSALPFTLIGGAAIINNHTDVIMLGWLRSAEEVGIYRVAVQGATLVAFGLQAANAVIAPQFARLHARGDMARLQSLVTQSARVILLVALPVTLAFMLAGGAIVGWVFGDEFAAAHLSLAILALGQLINAAFGSVALLLNMTGHESVSAHILWQTAVLNIVLNGLLIPFYGMSGAAVATALSLALWNFMLYRQVRNRLGLISTALRFKSL